MINYKLLLCIISSPVNLANISGKLKDPKVSYLDSLGNEPRCPKKSPKPGNLLQAVWATPVAHERTKK